MLDSSPSQDSGGPYLQRADRLMKIALFIKPFAMKACFSIVLFIYIVIEPSQASAGFFSDLITKVVGPAETQASEPAPKVPDVIHNSQNVPLLESSVNPDLKNMKDDAVMPAISPTDPVALSNNGALGIDSELEKYSSATKITTYVVKKGDNLDSISKKLNVPKSTIIASNSDLKKSDLLKIGQTLVIIALKSEVIKADKPADTTIAKKDDKVAVKEKEKEDKVAKTAPLAKATPKKEEPKEALDPTPAVKIEAPVLPSQLQTQTPPVEQPVQAVLPPTQPAVNVEVPPVTPSTPASDPGQPTGIINGGYIWPFPAGTGRVSQGLHADNAYDFSAPKGTPIYAVQSGTVLIAHPSGYNGGYGLYVVINFDDGRQAIFGHMSKVLAVAGQIVKQGDIIGYVGSTGKSTGPHLHLGFHGDLSNPYKGLKLNSTDLIEND